MNTQNPMVDFLVAAHEPQLAFAYANTAKEGLDVNRRPRPGAGLIYNGMWCTA